MPYKDLKVKKNYIYNYNRTRRRELRKSRRLIGTCSICGIKNVVLDKDHDHFFEQRRGDICRKCNLMLGLAQDNPIILERAAKYLIKYLGEFINGYAVGTDITIS